MSQFFHAAKSLLIGFIGVLFAQFWFMGTAWAIVLVVLGAIVVAAAADEAGKALLARSPVPSTYLLEWWILYPAIGAALGAAAVIVLAVELAAPETASPETKELVGALGTGITAFITTVFISWSEDADDSTLADHVRNAYQKIFDEYQGSPAPRGRHFFMRGSRGLRFVFSEEFEGISGWGRQARLARARAIRNELKSGASDPPSPA